MDSLCIKCKGKGMCGKTCKILSRFFDTMPKVKTHFSGSTPPEIFVGRVGYPDVFSGILSPNRFGDTSRFSMPEEWVSNNLTIEEVLSLRGQMIYARHQGNVKSQQTKNLTTAIQQLALSSKPVSTEFFLKKAPRLEFSASKYFSIMANPAPVEKAVLEENPRVPERVDKLVSDYDAKAGTALKELYKEGILNSHLNKLLSAGLLGVKIQRKLVPTRWAITAVDDTLSKFLLEKIRFYPEIGEIEIFHSEYNGNHYEFLLLPGPWSFEVIEAWKITTGVGFSQDYEGMMPRKTYADNVTGAYYANRLGIAEYLEKVKKQASVLVLRQISEQYYAPLGVGILREVTRRALQSAPEKAASLDEAFTKIQSRLNTSKDFRERSWLLKNYKKQKNLRAFGI